MGEKEDFFEAVKSGDFEKVKLLVEKNPSFVNAMDDTTLSPVLTAAYHGEMGIANYLVANGAKMDIFSSSALGLTYIVKTWCKNIRKWRMPLQLMDSSRLVWPVILVDWKLPSILSCMELK